mmetsp:Transcript_64837/g.148514  ORF Transcript_64837/g.148514 Transcript_64837/m.148514 type:complete len:233 (-) Transcript_64837:192-890(-)
MESILQLQLRLVEAGSRLGCLHGERPPLHRPHLGVRLVLVELLLRDVPVQQLSDGRAPHRLLAMLIRQCPEPFVRGVHSCVHPRERLLARQRRLPRRRHETRLERVLTEVRHVRKTRSLTLHLLVDALLDFRQGQLRVHVGRWAEEDVFESLRVVPVPRERDCCDDHLHSRTADLDGAGAVEDDDSAAGVCQHVAIRHLIPPELDSLRLPIMQLPPLQPAPHKVLPHPRILL